MIDTTEYKSHAFAACRFCHGRGCLYCPSERVKPQAVDVKQAVQQPKPEPEYWYRSSLLKRGWNDQLIAELIGPHDLEGKNPHWRSGPPTRLYLRSRVEEAEQSEAFCVKQVGREKRSAAAQKAVSTKREKITSLMEGLKIEISLIEDVELIERAVRNRNNQIPEWKWEKEDVELARVEDIAPWPQPDGFRDRIVVNYLRHSVSRYDRVLNELIGRVGKKEAHRMLREKVYAAISDTYAHLADECKRQMEARKGE